MNGKFTLEASFLVVFCFCFCFLLLFCVCVCVCVVVVVVVFWGLTFSFLLLCLLLLLLFCCCCCCFVVVVFFGLKIFFKAVLHETVHLLFFNIVTPQLHKGLHGSLQCRDAGLKIPSFAGFNLPLQLQ